MKILTESFWKNFTKVITYENKNEKIIRDGVEFEKLVFKLLSLMYNSSDWKGTGSSWDGSKDFYFYNQEDNKWAECKNYASPIDLKTLSPTLVMAEISDINEILFFCYSKINENARSKIIRFCNKRNRIVKFYDDESLEELILNYRNSLESFFDFTNINIDSFDKCNPIIDYSITNDFLINYPNKNELRKTSHQLVDNIKRGELIKLDFIITNRSIKELNFTLKIDNRNDIDYFDFLTLNELNHWNFKFKLAANEATIKSIVVRIKAYKKTLYLPSFIISEKNLKISKKISINGFKCDIFSEPLLIGSSYKEKFIFFKNNGLKENSFTSFILYGQSGVGKTKLSKEMLNEAIRNKFNILRFYGDNSNNSVFTVNTLLKELIYSVYNIPDEDTLYESEALLYPQNTPNKESIYEIQLIKEVLSLDKTSDIKNFINHKLHDLFSLLYIKKYFIVIDNVQYFDDLSLFLIQQIMSFGLQNNRKCNLCLTLIFNIDYIPNDSNLELYFDSLLHMGEKVYSIPLKGFKDPNETKSYLSAILSSDASFSDNILNTIVLKSGNNPYIVKETIEWLKNENCIDNKEGKYYIINNNLFLRKIKTIPSNIDNMLFSRWNKKIIDKKNALLIISMIHFLDGIPISKVKINKFRNAIRDLKKHNFIIDNMDSELLIFSHDLIENFFINEYPILSDIFIKEYLNLYYDNAYFDSVRQFYIKLYKTKFEKISSDEVMKLYEDFDSFDLPPKLSKDYYTKLFEIFMQNCKNFLFENWLEIIYTYLQKVHNATSNLFVKNFFDIVYNMIINNEKQISLLSLNFTIYYAELLDSLGSYDKAISITYYGYEKLLNMHNIDQVVKCIYLNRLNVYKRHNIEMPIDDIEILDYLNNSLNISNKLNLVELQYVNNSDLGYMYYIDDKYLDNVLSYWNRACKIFEENNIETKTLNYYRKKVQIALIYNDNDIANSYCDLGLKYIETGKYSYQKILFKRWFYIAKVANLLINYDNNKKGEIKKYLSIADEYEILMDSPKKFIIEYLRSIYYFFSKNNVGDSNLLIASLKNTYVYLMNSNYKTYKNVIKKQLLNNIIVMFEKCSINENEKISIEFNMFEEKDYEYIMKNISRNSKNKIKASSIIKSKKDIRINFPEI